MPSLESLSMTPTQRRELIQVFATLNLKNEIVFFLAVQEYKKIRTDKRAVAIHTTFLKGHASGERVNPGTENTDISFINIPLNAYTTQFRERYIPIEARVSGKFQSTFGKVSPSKRGGIKIAKKNPDFHSAVC